LSNTQNKNYPQYIELKLRPRVWLYSSREENLRRPIYDGRRGNLDPAVYGEYMPSWDNGHMVYAANWMSSAFPAIRGNDYKVQQLAGLYPTSEASDDYAYSRCFVD
jgi:carboxypeptidase T